MKLFCHCIKTDFVTRCNKLIVMLLLYIVIFVNTETSKGMGSNKLTTKKMCRTQIFLISV